MHSIRAFIKEKGIKFGVRVSTENFGTYHDVLTLSLYAVSELNRVVGSHQ